MTDSREAARRPVRAPLRRRSRRRWAIAGGVAMCWLVVEFRTGSAVTATVLLAIVGGLSVAAVAGLRAMGITRDHPWLRRMAARPWRDGQDVLNAAMRHLSDVLIVTPSGSLIAPDLVELQMNPDDLASLREQMELDVISTSVTEVYVDQVAERGARFAGTCRPEVYVVPDHSVAQGRYRLRRGLPASARYSPGAWDLPDAPDLMDRQFGYVAQESAAIAPDPVSSGSAPDWGDPEPASVPGYAQPVGAGPGGLAWYEAVDPSRTIMDGMATVMEQIRPAVPVLRLVTGSSVAETSMSGARAGRGPVELVLPDVPTVSRQHAKFTFSEGRWWVTNQGMNGLFINGVPVSGEQPLIDGDSIRWGKSADAPLSRVEIG
ncbi:MAG: FHA domain-containing protein [Trebonia sp.]